MSFRSFEQFHFLRNSLEKFEYAEEFVVCCTAVGFHVVHVLHFDVNVANDRNDELQYL